MQAQGTGIYDRYALLEAQANNQKHPAQHARLYFTARTGADLMLKRNRVWEKPAQAVQVSFAAASFLEVVAGRGKGSY